MNLWGEQIKQILTKQVVNDSLRRAARDILADSSERIFEKGLNSDNSSIGDYSTNPISISRKNSPKSFGSDKKSKFFPGGYKQFKQEVKGTDIVNLTLFGLLRNDYKTSKEVETSKGLKYELKNESNADKKDWMETHFKNDIFSLTRPEIETLKKTFEFEIAKRL